MISIDIINYFLLFVKSPPKIYFGVCYNKSVGTIDLGCNDFKGAARNRRMVKWKRNIVGYLEVEAILKNTPLSKPLPSWVPVGNLPKVGKEEYRGQNETKYLHSMGMHNIDEKIIEVNGDLYYTRPEIDYNEVSDE